MISTPAYLKPYASEQQQKGNRLSFKLRCSCGCQAFTISENDYTREEKKRIKEYEERIPDTGWHTLHGGIDDSGKPYHYIKILGIFKKYITFPQPPVFMEVRVVKATCGQCQKEITLFDSRYHGYDGVTSDDEKAKKYTPHFRQKYAQPCGIAVTVENEPSLEVFHEALGEPCSPTFHSNAFHWIGIYRLDQTGKKKILYEFETA